jgi:epoxide hydrolase-like predicted phosphatase
VESSKLVVVPGTTTPGRNMTIKAVVFDFGGVFTPSPFAALRAWHVEKELDPAAGVQAVFGPYDQDTDHPWHRLERGEISLTAAAAQIKAEAAERGLDLDLFAMFRAMGQSADGVRTEMVEKARELRAAGYRTALVTNNIREFSNGWRAMIPAGEMFDVIVDSSAVGIRKPDHRIYRMALQQLGVEPEESVFLDDAPGNVEAARALGMHGILVEDDHTGALAELDRLLTG